MRMIRLTPYNGLHALFNIYKEIFCYPVQSFLFVFADSFLVFSDVLILAVSMDAIVSSTADSENFGGKLLFLFKALGMEDVVSNRSPIFVYVSILLLLCLLIVFFLRLKQYTINSIRANKIKASVARLDCSQGEILSSIKDIRVQTEKLQNALRLCVFFIFNMIFLLVIAALQPLIATILIFIVGLYLVLSIRIQEKQNKFNQDFLEKEKLYLKATKSKDLSQKQPDFRILQDNFWDYFVRRNDLQTTSGMLSNVVKFSVIILVIMLWHIPEDSEFQLYPILVIFIIGKFVLYLEGISSNLRRLQ